MKTRFTKRAGCYNCEQCGKQTRTVEVNEGTRLCELCAVKTTCGNSLSDAGFNGNAWTIFDNCSSVAECYKEYNAQIALLNPEITP